MNSKKIIGARILSRIGLVNEATVFFLQTVEPTILQIIDDIIADFADEEGWLTQFETDDGDRDCWLAPEEWGGNYDIDGDFSPKACFELGSVNRNDDSWTALFCRKSTQGGEAGFKFIAHHSNFSERAAWNRFARKIPNRLIAELEDLGFRRLSPGCFFLPVHLDANKLSKAWQSDMDFSVDNESFEPIYRALQALDRSKWTFLRILDVAAPCGGHVFLDSRLS